MPEFGAQSLANLETCAADLQTLAHVVILHYDFSVIEGHRSLIVQQRYFAQGRSDKDGIIDKSNHQAMPSNAMDLLPYPRNMHGLNIWNDTLRFAHFVGMVRGHAEALSISIRVGWDWNGDGSCKDHKLIDYPHVELL